MTTLSDRCDEAMARALCKRTGNDPDEQIADNGMPCWTAYVPDVRAARIALLAVLDAEGWQVVPKVATDEMTVAVRRLDWTSPTDIDWPDGYAAMLAAAPQPFQEDKP